MQEIRALSFKFPYSHLMAHHGKVETRTWNTPYRGLVLICTSKAQYLGKAIEAISGPVQRERIQQIIRAADHPYRELGKAIAIGRLDATCRMEQYQHPNAERDTFVSYNPDLYCHIYEDVRLIQPFHWIGARGWRTLTAEQIQLIRPLDGKPLF